MRYYIIAGEASGDLHASNLVAELGKLDPGAEFRGWGGDRMQANGVTLVRHYRELAFMGFLEVVANLRTILRNLAFCKRDLTEYRPDALVLVDYPGFNLRIARYAHAQGIRVFYYISPQVWAWNKSRVYGIRETVDRMFVILPFEKSFYAAYGYDVSYVGHPLLDVIGSKDFRAEETEDPVVVLLPGSRKQEIRHMLPAMLDAASKFPGHKFVIAGAPSIPESCYREAGKNRIKCPVVYGRTYKLLSRAKAAVVTSGTATLETALFEVPEVVCYKGNYLSYLMARKMVKVPYISLVNLVLDRPAVKELIQQDMNAGAIARELDQLLNDPEKRNAMKSDFRDLKEKLGGGGASRRTAEQISRIMSA